MIASRGMESRYVNPAIGRQPIGEQNDKLEVDATGSAFVNAGYRWGVAVEASTPLVPPCDALNLSAGATITVQMAEETDSSTTVSLTLPAGISRIGVVQITDLGGASIVALYVRKPPSQA